ncbi:MAG: LPS export ABC transporter periplasmic protein LptC [Chitinophagaceae bacterium]
MRSLHILGSILLLAACNRDIEKAKGILNTNELNTDIAKDVTIFYSKDGDTKAKLATPVFKHMLKANPTYVEMPKGLVAHFYDENKNPTTKLTAKYGLLYEQTNNVLVRDSVVVSNIKNEKLETEELIWNEKLQRFFTDKFVKITTPTQIIYGDGLESNQTFTSYKIMNVKGIIGIQKNQMPLP